MGFRNQALFAFFAMNSQPNNGTNVPNNPFDSFVKQKEFCQHVVKTLGIAHKPCVTKRKANYMKFHDFAMDMELFECMYALKTCVPTSELRDTRGGFKDKVLQLFQTSDLRK